MAFRSLFVLIVLSLTLFSCYKVIPGGFWATYDKEYLIHNVNDQGPYGGQRSMFWRHNIKKNFTSSQLIDFATKNGWRLIDSVAFSAFEVNKWKNIKPTFPFSYTNFKDSSTDIAAFPRWIYLDIKLYRFKTGWIAIEPGNKRQTDINGYIVINNDGTELSVYHLWGE